ncbi:MAG: hypothetical protein DME70_08265 [Verrucomicrobia bacterium]|nr:MAG: hypothetical protein DME70_08265 [Verrucomicrobiota bacterium]
MRNESRLRRRCRRKLIVRHVSKGARLLGGYCGTTPGHIAAVVGVVAAL